MTTVISTTKTSPSTHLVTFEVADFGALTVQVDTTTHTVTRGKVTLGNNLLLAKMALKAVAQ